MPAFEVKVGTYENTTGINRTQVVTGVGFQSKFLMVFSANLDVASLEAVQLMQAHNVGFARSGAIDGTGQVSHGVSACWNFILQHTQGTADAGSTDCIHETYNLGNGAQGSSTDDTLMSLDADGFTLHGTAFSTNVHHYLALGGDVVAEPFQHPTCPTSTGTQTITGASQAPTLAIFCVTTPHAAEAPTGYTWAMGWYDGTRQGVSAIQQKMFASTGIDQQYESAAHCLALQDPVTGALIGRAACTGFTDDGLTLDWDVAPDDGVTFTVILLSGLAAECGALTQLAMAGTQVVSVPTVDPQAVVFLSTGRPASASVEANVRLTMGLSDADAQLGTWHGDNTGTTSIANQTNTHYMSRLATITMAHPNPGTPFTGDVDAQATVTAFDPDGAFTVEWSLVDGPLNEVLYLVLGPAVVPPPPPPEPSPLVIRTRRLRRLRRSPHVWDAAAGHRIFYPGFQLIFEAGVPVPPLAPPLVSYFATDEDYLTRSASQLDPAQDWTRAFWTSTGPDTQDLWLLDDDGDFSAPYVTVGWTADGDGWTLQADPGSGAVTATFVPPTLYPWTYLAIRYRAVDGEMDLLVNSVVAATITVDLSAMPSQTFEYLGSDLASPGGANLSGFGYERTWQSALSLLDLAREQRSPHPFGGTNLLAASTLRFTSTGLRETSAEGPDWTVHGTRASIVGPLPADPEPLRFALRYSDDGSKTWSSLLWKECGLPGQYESRAWWKMLGSTQTSRVYEVVSDSVCRHTWIDALLEPKPYLGRH